MLIANSEKFGALVPISGAISCPGRDSSIFWWGYSPVHKTLTRFHGKICNFRNPISDLESIPFFRPKFYTYFKLAGKPYPVSDQNLLPLSDQNSLRRIKGVPTQPLLEQCHHNHTTPCTMPIFLISLNTANNGNRTQRI